jgi:hypothetical protein
MQKRTEITIETERLLVVKRRPENTVLWCSSCSSSLPMLALDVAASRAGASLRSIVELADAGQLHSALTPDGRLFICADSLAAETVDTRPQPGRDLNF